MNIGRPKETKSFDRNLAFSRNVGVISQSTLDILKDKTVAIAGLGGAGGSHLLTLVRLGIGGFHIADMDQFGIENFNRQVGANLFSVGRDKVEVMSELALAINPDLRIKSFRQGVTPQNLDEFFSGVDAYVDGLDFFAFRIREKVFRYCFQHQIPATTVGPIAMSAALINFIPGGMSFDDYFNWKETDTDVNLAIKFILGLTPGTPQRAYLADRKKTNFAEKKGPSTPMGIELSAGVMGCEILKILTVTGRVYAAPHAIVYDGYLNKLFHRYTPFGNRNPLQRLKFWIAKKFIV